MSIANKIILLIALLLGALSIDIWMGLGQIGHIRSEFASMSDYNVVLTKAVTSIRDLQLQKNILLQQLIGIAEELGFEQVTFARRSYLEDQLKAIHEQFSEYAHQGMVETQRARRAINAAYELADDDERGQLQDTMDGLNRLEGDRYKYSGSLDQLLNAVKAGGFQLSLEDLENLQQQEIDLSRQVGQLLKQVQDFSRHVLAKTGQWEAQAQHWLVLSLWITAMAGCVLALWIVRSITRPLELLSKATGEIGQGNFNVRVSTASRDELARLGQAFNSMSGQLEEFKARLEKQNMDLKATNEELDRFIHIMGHDIANPLTMMIAYCAYIEQHAGTTMDEKNMEALQGIRKASTKMHKMVKELLEFTRSKRPKASK